MEFKSPYIAFSAPSGAGKTTIVKHLAGRYPQTVISVSATTRPKRPFETDGVDYIFLSEEAFKQAIAQGKFLEYEQVHGNYYGTLLETVEGFRRQGKVVLFDIDVNGALAIKDRFPEAILIFIKPPSTEELVRRLKARKSETEASIKKRLERLEFEYAQAGQFDYTIVNDDLQTAIAGVEALILKDKA
jgi:guanylate kinase